MKEEVERRGKREVRRRWRSRDGEVEEKERRRKEEGKKENWEEEARRKFLRQCGWLAILSVATLQSCGPPTFSKSTSSTSMSSPLCCSFTRRISLPCSKPRQRTTLQLTTSSCQSELILASFPDCCAFIAYSIKLTNLNLYCKR